MRKSKRSSVSTACTVPGQGFLSPLITLLSAYSREIPSQSVCLILPSEAGSRKG